MYRYPSVNAMAAPSIAARLRLLCWITWWALAWRHRHWWTARRRDAVTLVTTALVKGMCRQGEQEENAAAGVFF